MDLSCCCWRLSGWAPESREGALDVASLGLLVGREGVAGQLAEVPTGEGTGQEYSSRPSLSRGSARRCEHSVRALSDTQQTVR